MVKRLFDIVFSLFGLVVFIPVFLLAAVLVRLDSPGPVLFLQTRVGKGFKLFKIIKFRTMTVDASSRGPAVTSGGDPRITRVGRVLRKTKLDELPQLFNVLRGEMSFVGPRPEVPKYVEMFREDYERILEVRPGITDYATFEYCNEEEVLKGYRDPEDGYLREVLPAKIKLYDKYLSRRSLLTDIGLIVRTLCKIVLK